MLVSQRAHWTDNSEEPQPGFDLVFDLWPDTSEYSDLYETDLHFSDGSYTENFRFVKCFQEQMPVFSRHTTIPLWTLISDG